MTRYVALLRGINVGGRNLIRMPDLAACFEAHGYEDVTTYIQSGNVIFSTTGPGGSDRESELTTRIRQMLASTFDYPGTVTLRSRDQLRAIVDAAPDGFGAEPDVYRYDVIFLLPPLDVSEAMQVVEPREGVDRVDGGPGVLYFSRLIERASQSRMSKIVSKPGYQHMTIRNWNTTTRILGLLERTR